MRILISSWLALSLAACSVEQVQPEVPEFSHSSFQSDGFRPDQSWWTSFDDPQLSKLIEKGLKQNQDFRAAFYRLQQSQAAWDADGSGQFPSLNATLERSQVQTGSADSSTVTTDSWSAGLSASYELDFWGNIAAQKEQGEFNYLASEAAVRTVSNTVAGEITKAWYGWMLEREKLALLAQQEQRIEASLKAVQGRYARGQVTVSDIWQQQQTLESLTGDTALSKRKLEIYKQTLALWLSMTSQELAEVLIQHSTLPASLSSVKSVSSQALQSRPDVVAAYFELQSAAAGLSIAQSNRYPRFTLTASYSGSDENFGSIFDNWASNLAAGLFLPVIDGGALRAEVRRNEAVVQEKIAAYKQTLLAAAQEVEESLVSEEQQSVYVESLQKQLQLAQKTQGFQERRYRKGVGDFIDMSNAQQNVLQLERQVLDARWQQLQYRIQLYRALAQGVTQTVEDEQAEVKS